MKKMSDTGYQILDEGLFSGIQNPVSGRRR